MHVFNTIAPYNIVYGTYDVLLFAKWRNLQIRVSQGKSISITGSMWKAYHGHNNGEFTKLQLCALIAEINNDLKIDVSVFALARLDIACNIVLRCQVVSYFPMLALLPGYDRQQVVSSLYFIGVNKVLSFYDKKVDGMNLMRYEVRYKSRVGEQAGVKDLRSVLQHYDFLHSYLADEYQQVIKTDKFTMSSITDYMSKKTAGVITRKDFMEALAAKTMSEQPVKVYQLIDELDSAGKLYSRSEKSRMKKDARALLAKVLDPRSIVHELNDKIFAL